MIRLWYIYIRDVVPKMMKEISTYWFVSCSRCTEKRQITEQFCIVWYSRRKVIWIHTANVWKEWVECCDLSPIISDYLYSDLICTHPVHRDFRPTFPKTPGPWMKLAHVVSSVWNPSLLLRRLTLLLCQQAFQLSVTSPRRYFGAPALLPWPISTFPIWAPLKKNKRPTSLPKREAFQNRKTWLSFVFQNLKLAPNKHLLHVCCLEKGKGMTFLNTKV